MGLVVLTLQDEPDGNVALGYTVDPPIMNEAQELTDAQILGMMAVHNLVAALNGEAGEATEETADSV